MQAYLSINSSNGLKVIDWNICNNMVWLISFTLINPTLSFDFRYPHNLSQPFGVHVSNMKRLKLCACGDSTPHFFPLRGTEFISGKPSFSMKIALTQFTKFNTEVILSKNQSNCTSTTFYFGFHWPVRLSGYCDILLYKTTTTVHFCALVFVVSKSSILKKASQFCD